MPGAEPTSVIPAQLSFLAIYNPLLGTTDETLEEQIVFYSSKATRSRRTRSTDAESAATGNKDDRNAKLRQIGLAQGMVSFAKWALLHRAAYVPGRDLTDRNPETFLKERQSIM